MAQLRTAPPRWLWHRGLRPCAPVHFGLLHKKPERFHIQTIMWLEVPLPHTDYYVTWSSAVLLPHMEYSLAWSSASAQGIYWDLKFRFRIQNSVWLGALKWRNSASAQGKYCGLEVTQFRFHTINLVRELWLYVPQFRLHTKNILWLEVPQFRFRTRNILCLEVQQFCFRTQNNLWLEVPQFSTIYCDLNFRSSASARKDVIWNSALLLLHENITFLWKIHSHSTAHPFLNFRAVLHDWWTLWRTEKQRNRDAPGKSRR